MKRYKWSFIYTDSRWPRNLPSVGMSAFLIGVCAAAAVIGLAGFGRLVYVGVTYAVAAYDAAEQHRENGRLRDQVENLERFVGQKADNINRLTDYEDNARLKYGMPAISSDVRKAGVGGYPSSDDILYASMLDPISVKAESLRMQVSSLNHQAELQESTFLQVSRHAQRVQGSLTKRPATWPATGRLTSTFGYRYHPFNGLRLMHEGIDIANNLWTPIHATADGQVKEASMSAGFGNVVKITHNTYEGEYITVYAHMQKSAVVQGQAVKRGDVIGYMGNTGRSTGTHLHYEVHKGGRPINPMEFIVPADQIVD